MDEDCASEPVDPEVGRSKADWDAELELLLEEEAALAAGGASRGEPGAGSVLVLGMSIVVFWVLVIVALVLHEIGFEFRLVGDLLNALPFSLLGGAW